MRDQQGKPGQQFPRDPGDRAVAANDVAAVREKNMDKTIADSFPTSDPPSTVPDPSEEES